MIGDATTKPLIFGRAELPPVTTNSSELILVFSPDGRLGFGRRLKWLPK